MIEFETGAWDKRVRSTPGQIAMLSASENLVIQHREIVAVVATYALFFLGVMAIAWLIA